MSKEMKNQLSEFIASEILNQPGREIGEDEKLISSGLIDSLSLVDISLFVEEQFQVIIDDTELKYGLSITGSVHPDKVITNANAQAGDKLVLTKPVGTGLITTALKAGKVSADSLEAITASMTALNKSGAEAMAAIEAHACTDVTGFGLLGHLCEMMCASKVSCTINAASVPLFPGVEKSVKAKKIPAGPARG